MTSLPRNPAANSMVSGKTLPASTTRTFKTPSILQTKHYYEALTRKRSTCGTRQDMKFILQLLTHENPGMTERDERFNTTVRRVPFEWAAPRTDKAKYLCAHAKIFLRGDVERTTAVHRLVLAYGCCCKSTAADVDSERCIEDWLRCNGYTKQRR